jgi:hypothetical protein
VHDDAAHAGFDSFSLGVLGEVSAIVEYHFARYISIFEELDLSLHDILVGLTSSLHTVFKHLLVTLSASDVHVGLHKFDESLQIIRLGGNRLTCTIRF